MKYHVLRLENLSLPVHLGCGAEERAQSQEVRWTVELRWDQSPVGARTDEIADTVCYADLAGILRDHCASGEFKLIERLAEEAFAKLRSVVPNSVPLAVRLHKVKPPVEDLLGGSIYECGDFLL